MDQEQLEVCWCSQWDIYGSNHIQSVAANKQNRCAHDNEVVRAQPRKADSVNMHKKHLPLIALGSLVGSVAVAMIIQRGHDVDDQIF